MSPRLSQACTLVLLLAMMLALATGLMAWGPMVLQPSDHRFAGGQPWHGLPNAACVLSCLPLLMLCGWGALAVQRSAWIDAVRAPWLGFFGLAALMSASAALYHLDPSDIGHAVTQALAAAALTMLGLAFLAERVDELFGSLPALLGGCGVVGFATLWWFAGHWSDGHGDLRALVFLQCLPLLLIPAGALTLPGDHTRAADWIAMLGLYAVARLAGLADAALWRASGLIGGHAVMHLLFAAVAACVAYRAAVAPGLQRPPSVSAFDPTQRSTSLNGSS